MASNHTDAIPSFSSETALLEALIPGYSILSRFFISYLKIDLNAYLQVIIAFAVLVGGIRLVYPQIFDSLSDLFISTAEIRMEDEVFTYMMHWLSRQSTIKKTNRFLASIKLKTDPWGDDDENGDESDDDEDDFPDQPSQPTTTFSNALSKFMSRDKYKSIKFTPSEGSHYFWYNGRLMKLVRQQEQSKGFYNHNERLWLSCLGWNAEPLKELLAEAQQAFIERDGTRTVIYRARREYDRIFEWIRCMSRAPRPMSTVILDQSQKQAIVDDMEEYLHPNTRRWYSNRGIPYRRGYLLHGPPGTGKTSLCFAAAGALGLKMYLLNLKTNSLDEEAMASLFEALPRRCIVLLEDIDTAGVTKTRGKTVVPESDIVKPPTDEDAPERPPDDSAKDGITLSGLLNVIDGVAACEGRILVMTTNHPENIDAALLRPGRVDMSIGFGYTTEADIQELFASIYKSMEGDDIFQKYGGNMSSTKSEETTAEKAKDEETQRLSHQDRISKLSASFAKAIPSGEFTAAEVQGYLLNHKNKPEAAIAGASKWVEEVRKKKDS